MVTTLKSEDAQKKVITAINPLKEMGSIRLRFNQLTRIEIKSGCANKPTPTSEAVRLSNNVLKGFGNNAVFLIAWMVRMFKMIVVQLKKLLKTQVATSDGRKPSTSAEFPKKDSLRRSLTFFAMRAER